VIGEYVGVAVSVRQVAEPTLAGQHLLRRRARFLHDRSAGSAVLSFIFRTSPVFVVIRSIGKPSGYGTTFTAVHRL
jgi:hypothetical protein